MRCFSHLPPLVALTLLLAACTGSGSPGPKSVSAAPVPPPPAPVVQHLPGVEGVIGANAAELAKLFGQPRLDLSEGDARKLQFSGATCVLDVYLYPPAENHGEPTATYVDARRPGDGKEVDRGACVTALRQPQAVAKP